MGSPPRVRGKPSDGMVPLLIAGITPACAGKTQFPPFVQGLLWDHPRVCGENNRSRNSAKTGAGSPPRVRGKPAALAKGIKDIGITPACAGKTSATSSISASTWDHPRVCGENRSRTSTSEVMMGSPPRVRGKHREGRLPKQDAGITPACAGKTNCFRAYGKAIGDHPRVCGENRPAMIWRRNILGSPPRVRGKLR